MGKLHGLTIGLDVCSTLHMDVSLDDLDWCLDRVVPAGPAYLIALPSKNDPMLGYLTTAYSDHVRLREKFGLRVDEKMWAFFKRIGVLDASGRPTARFGDPAWVYREYRRRKGDARPDAEIAAEARKKIADVRGRGVPLAIGYGEKPWDLEPALDREIRALYADAKKAIWTTISPAFVAALPGSVPLRTRSADRPDYILHPESGEALDARSEEAVRALRGRAADFDVQVVVSDGLSALAITDSGHLAPYLAQLRASLETNGLRLSPTLLVVTSGRVRAGYRIGETLFGGLASKGARRTVVHLIGERPGSMHHTFSAYVTSITADQWGGAGGGRVDHDVTRVVSGMADTALHPDAGARETVKILVAGTAPSRPSPA